MLAIELSTSSDCAREMRGTASIDSAVIGLRASTSTTSGFSAGCSSAINVAPGFIWSSSASDGALIANTTSACQASPIVASASTKLSSGKSARWPASGATTTSYPSCRSWPTVFGVAATRVSPGLDSRTTPISTARH